MLNARSVTRSVNRFELDFLVECFFYGGMSALFLNPLFISNPLIIKVVSRS